MPQEQDWRTFAAELGGVAAEDWRESATELGGEMDAIEELEAVASHDPTANDASSLQSLRASPGFQRMQAERSTREQMLPSALAASAAFAAGPGFLLPALAAGGAGYLGGRLLGESREDAAATGLGEGALAGVAGGLSKIPSALRRIGRRAVKGGLKVDRGYLQNMAAARRQGLMGAEDEIVDTVMRSRINPVTTRGADQLQRLTEQVASERAGRIAAAPGLPVSKSGAATTQVLNRRLAQGLHRTESEPTISATRDIMRSLASNPRYGAMDVPGSSAPNLRDLTPRELAARVEADNAALRGMFGQAQTPAIEAVKAVRNLNARMLDRAAGTSGLSQRMKQLIDLRNVSNIARRRGEARDVVGITDLVSLSAGRPLVLGATTAMRPAAQTQLGLVLDRLSRVAPIKGTPADRAIVQAMLSRLFSGQPEEP